MNLYLIREYKKRYPPPVISTNFDRCGYSDVHLSKNCQIGPQASHFSCIDAYCQCVCHDSSLEGYMNDWM